MNITKSLAQEVGVRPACNALDVSRAGFYRWQHPHEKKPLCRLSPLALSSSERNDVLDILHAERFIDKAPQEIYATLLDEKSYLCSVRTMYRILRKEGELKERRKQVSRPRYTKPEYPCASAQRSVELGHHEAQRAGEVDLLLSLRDPRHLQPLCRGVDGGPQGTIGSCP